MWDERRNEDEGKIVVLGAAARASKQYYKKTRKHFQRVLKSLSVKS
jgi:hypothetical protein